MDTPLFKAQRIATHEANIYTVSAGAGEPVLLLHGFPQTHAMWHAIDCGHFVPEERHAETLAALQGFLASVSSP